MRDKVRGLIIGLSAALALGACATGMGGAPHDWLRSYSAAETGGVLSASDEYTRELTASDLSIRLQDPQGGSVAALQALYRRSGLDWTSAEKMRLDAMEARVQGRLAALARWLPDEVGLMKASEAVEGGFPHTRGTAISFGPVLPDTDAELDTLFFHELWHVISRRNASRHDEMYALMGFVPCTEVTLSPGLDGLRITNPDAPVDRHVAPVAGAEGRWLLPRLSASSARYTPELGSFPDYFDLKFLVMTRDAFGRCALVRNGDEIAQLAPQAALPILRAVAGANTNYVFHPEEMLADNFAQLMMRETPQAANPEVHRRIADWLGVSEAEIAALTASAR